MTIEYLPAWPERRSPDDGAGDEDSYNAGWNDCRVACHKSVEEWIAANLADTTALLSALDAEIDSWALVPAHFHGAMKRKIRAAVLTCASKPIAAGDPSTPAEVR